MTPSDLLFEGLGEMRARCRAFDWSGSSLGSVGNWPASLRTTVAMLLASKHPMFLWWGPDLIQILNDAYQPSLGEGARSLRALGARGREFWTDAWVHIGPQIDQVMAGGDATWHEDQLVPILRNGQMEDVWWTYGFGPVVGDDGHIAGVLVVCTETTQRVRTTSVLEAQLERLAEVFRQAPSFLAVLRGPEHVFELVNDAYRQLVGHRDLIGRSVFDAIPEGRGQSFALLLDGVFRTGDPFVGRELPLTLARTRGALPEERFLDFIFLPMLDSAGTRVGVIAHGTDVTAYVQNRRDVERLLAQSERERAAADFVRLRTQGLQSLTAALSSAASITEIATETVVHASDMLDAAGTVVARFSADRDEMEILHAHPLPDSVRADWGHFPVSADVPLAEVARTGEPVFLESRDAWVARYPALEHLVDELGHQANMVVPLVVHGSILGALGVAFKAPRTFDVSDRATMFSIAGQCAVALERARLFEAEQKAHEEAERANRAKGEFLAVMSHELRTPLNAIGGYAELMELGIRGPITAEQREDLHRIQQSQRHLLGLINQVLNYARVDAGAVRYEVADVTVSEELAAAEALVMPQMRMRKLLYIVAYPEPALVARADREKLQQVLLNLLTNAIKFTEEGGEIRVGAQAREGMVLITVADTGIGIAADKRATVFDPFVQVQSGYTRTNEGVGLGLAISRELARGMSGDLTVESTLGKGSTFTLAIPKRA